MSYNKDDIMQELKKLNGLLDLQIQINENNTSIIEELRDYTIGLELRIRKLETINK